MLDRIARARAKARAHAWGLIAATPAGFPWLVIAGKVLDGWIVIDMDATLVPRTRIRKEPLPPGRKDTVSTRWGPGAGIRASAWPCC